MSDPAEHAAEVIVPVVAVICIFGLPMLAFICFRLFAHRERMEMLRNGIVPPVSTRDWRKVTNAGQRSPISAVPGDYSVDSAQSTLRKGIVITFIGFAITLGLSFIGFQDDSSLGWRPGPWLLGGLVPMFVGLAQVIIALLSGASLRPVQYQPYRGPHMSDMPDAPPPSPGAPFEGSYTYRPGTTQELRPPVPPPERRG